MTTAPLYDSFAKHYDSVVGDRADVARYLSRLIRRYHPKAQTVLELGCGSGSMLATLSKHYATLGIDSSKEMLRIAKTKAPRSKLVHGDITSFNLRGGFDVILCPFDTINHITTFASWCKVFSRVHRHLNAGGIFIFDVNTEHKMEEYRLDPVQADISTNAVSIVQVTRQARFRYTVHLKLFKKMSRSTYRLQEMNLPELVVPTEKICAALARHFSSVTLIDPDRARPTKLTEELYFVCQNARSSIAAHPKHLKS